MSCIPIAWIRSTLPSTNRELEQQKEEVLKRRARINAWIDRLMESGCSPWDEGLRRGREESASSGCWVAPGGRVDAIIVRQDLYQSPTSLRFGVYQ